jgi:DNA-directed RNA polymerase sigma subunit (sigma70/sigma32)
LKIPNNIDLSRTEWERLIDEWIFNERDRAILKRRLLDGKTFEQLAEEFDLSTQNIQRIVYKSQNKLFLKI